MEERLIRVMVVDDHVVVRSGLAAFLMVYDDLQLVGEAEDGEEAVRRCGELKPDVILMDLVMPGSDGVSAIRTIHQRWPEVRIIALTSFRDQELVEGALSAGALSYLLKDVTAVELVQAIRSAYAGHSTLAPAAAEALIQAADHTPQPGHDLTARELEVLALIVQGLNNTEIADKLVISRNTARFHVSNILTKLNAVSRSEAAAIAVQHKLVDAHNAASRKFGA
jgi:NarL family two-component system response regulator LiaR